MGLQAEQVVVLDLQSLVEHSVQVLMRQVHLELRVGVEETAQGALQVEQASASQVAQELQEAREL